MDDDIRDRFRGVNRGNYDAPLRPRPAAPAPRPASPPSPSPAPKSPTSVPAWAKIDDDEPIFSTKAVKPAKVKRSRRKKGKKLRKFLLTLLILAALAAGGFVAYKKFLHKTPTTPPVASTNQSTTQTQTATKPTGTIRFIATGDNLAFDSINNYAHQPDGSYNYLPMMSLMKPLFANADIRLCNETTPAGGAGLGVSGYPNFNSPVEWTVGFAGVGCNLINLATDHINDKAQAGIDGTVDSWSKQSNNLAVAGANK